MANYVFNIAKGRVVEFFNRVDSNDPANSAIIVVPLSATDTEANRQDDDDLQTFLAAAPNEAGGSWGRKTLTDVELSAIAVDDANNRFPASVPLVTWTTPSVGQDTVGVVICYDSDTTGGTDANIIPLVHCDFVITANGANVSINAGDVFRAS